MTTLVMLTVMVTAVSGQRAPTISFISGAGSGEVVTDLGKSAELVCQVKNGKEYPINWIKISGDKKEDYEYFPLSTGKTLAIRDSRFNLSSEAQQNSLSTTLQINNIEEIDDAIYQCQVIVGIENKITKEVKLRVKTPVVIKENSTVKLTVVEGEEAVLDCQTGGFPTPTVSWVRPDGKVLFTGKLIEEGNRLEMARVRREDQGEYRCTAENSVGEPKTHDVSLTVRFGPSVRAPRPRLQQALGYDAVLRCEMEAFPAPSIDWSKAGSEEGEYFDNSGQYSVAHFSRGPTITLSTLRIDGLTEANFGLYECRASNSEGSALGSVELRQTNIPIPEAAFSSGCASQCGLMSAVLSSLLLVFSRL